jgi:hypothetical protein
LHPAIPGREKDSARIHVQETGVPISRPTASKPAKTAPKAEVWTQTDLYLLQKVSRLIAVDTRSIRDAVTQANRLADFRKVAEDELEAIKSKRAAEFVGLQRLLSEKASRGEKVLLRDRIDPEEVHEDHSDFTWIEYTDAAPIRSTIRVVRGESPDYDRHHDALLQRRQLARDNLNLFINTLSK